MEDSICELITAMPSLTLREVRLMRFRRFITKINITGTTAIRTSASLHSIVSITTNAPMNVSMEMKTSSGPW